ncbi:MAG: type I-C CRISPR-associated protein Cas8c/Csd1 [Armatimonadetes bacterium]|nr:type I-C CRISPR-associated protein Cas8c/Csd1 [Armatimonadota bacterium]
MILNRLVEFAETLGASIPSGYQPQFVTKVVELDREVKSARLIQLSKDKRGKRDGENRHEPQEAPRRASGIRARPFADNCEYLLGKVFEGADQSKVRLRHEAWRESVLTCAAEIDNPEVQAVAAWVRNDGPTQLAQDSSLQPDDYFTISVSGQIVTELPEVRTWWANQTDTPERGTCLVTGIEGPILERMPAMIRGIPDGQMSGTALVSVNFTAGNSYGLEAAYNSPISPDAGEKIGNALNHLLSERLGDELIYTVKVGKVAFVGWSRVDAGKGQIRAILDPDNADAGDDDLDEAELREIARVRGIKEAGKSKGQITSVGLQGDLFNTTTDKAGRTRAIRLAPAMIPQEIEAEHFYMLALSANAARIIVRDFHTMTLGDLIERREAWFEKLSLAGHPKRHSLYQLATSLYREAKDIPAHVTNTLAWCALLGRPMPSSILGLAVKRNLAMQGPYTVFKGGGKGLAHARMALIKAALLDDPLLQAELLENPQRKEEFKMLNPTHPEPAYHCGRLLAVLESIQKNAISGLNATVVDRHYGAACASPASVFGTLLTNATRSHMPKIRKEKGGMHTIFEKQLSEVLSALGSEFPRTLSLQQQAIFSLGFYQQKSHDIETAIAKRDAKADAASDSPEGNN